MAAGAQRDRPLRGEEWEIPGRLLAELMALYRGFARMMCGITDPRP